MNRGVRISAASAAATVAVVAAVGHAIGHLGASEAEASSDARPAVHFIASAVQESVAAEDLIGAVRGIDPVACRLVGRALENRWGRGGVAPWWTLPGDGGADATRSVTQALRGEVSPEQAPLLIESLGSVDDCERRVAAQLLGRISDTGLADRLGGVLRSGAPRARVGAALALGFGEWQTGVPALAGVMNDPDADLRATAAWALGRTEHVDAIAPLTAALDDASVEVRANAVVGLGWVESTRAVEPLSRALEDSEAQIRINAAWALGQIESPTAIPVLTDLLGSDADPEVRRAAAWALGRIE